MSLLDGLPWISLHGGLRSRQFEILQRKDVRELIVQLSPLRTIAVQLSPDEWHTIMSVGAGLSSLKATRLTDETTVVSGVLSDNPSLLCEFGMKHTNQNSNALAPNAIVFCIDNLKMFLSE